MVRVGLSARLDGLWGGGEICGQGEVLIASA